ncbi:hypothetical protein QCA50_016114 [Cerrena zonata]|uniref:Vacuolar protein-sorting-associated protein 36 n=1 Tax=Cerrena zonata TaxID=2478898 RepID=A0AAW0FGZ0_9APHY
MGVLKRYTKPVDGTIPVPALLYDDESLLTSQESVGMYDGTQKSPKHQNGTVYTTTHRLFYVDHSHPHSRSFSLDLSSISRTDYYAGLFTSSPKITLYLHANNPSRTVDASSNDLQTWECEVCSYKNPPGLSPAASKLCGLCGVPRNTSQTNSGSPSPIPPKLTQHSSSQFLSTSLPSSATNLLSTPGSSTNPAQDAIIGANGEIPCPACTFLNHPSLPACEICGTALPRPKNVAGHPFARSAPSSRPVSPSPDEDEEDDDDDDTEATRLVRLSFRKGGDKSFYATLRRSLLGKGWESKVRSSSTPASQASGTGQGGLNSILRTVENTAANTQSNMEDALQDIESLAVKARDMVRMAEDLNEKLTVATATHTASNIIEPEEATFIRSSLSQLGLQMPNAPVTLDMMRDERRWHEELARELASVLQGNGSSWKQPGTNDEQGGGMMRKRGIIALDEVWGGWNRARGVALIPPSTFLSVLPHLPSYTSPPIHMRKFSTSGLSVLHTPPYARDVFADRMVTLLTLGPKTTVEVAHEEQLPVGLVQDMIAEAERFGDICRDEGGSGINIFGGRTESGEVRWWNNIFMDYEWDGQAS